jgi:alanine dehydrogenase
VTELLVLTDAQVGELVDYGEAIEVVEDAFRDFGQGRATMPSKVYLSLPRYHGDIRAMPAAAGDLYAGVKLVNSHEQNPSKGLPAVVGTYLLFSQETGMPLCLMAATLLTAIRTGAASGVASRYMARQDARSLGLIGAGVQAAHQLRSVSRVRMIERVVVWAPEVDRARTEVLAAGLEIEFPQLQIRIAGSAGEAAASDIICTTTPSRAPLFHAGAVRAGAHINAVGADGPGKQELDPEILKSARVVVDELDQAIHGGEINVALASKAISMDQIAGTLSEVVSGAIPGRTSQTETTVFDSTGLAIQDIALAILVYERAMERGLGSTVSL